MFAIGQRQIILANRIPPPHQKQHHATPQRSVADRPQKLRRPACQTRRQTHRRDRPIPHRQTARHAVVILDPLEPIPQTGVQYILDLAGQPRKLLLDLWRLGPHPRRDQRRQIIRQRHQRREMLPPPRRVHQRQFRRPGPSQHQQTPQRRLNKRHRRVHRRVVAIDHHRRCQPAVQHQRHTRRIGIPRMDPIAVTITGTITRRGRANPPQPTQRHEVQTTRSLIRRCDRLRTVQPNLPIRQTPVHPLVRSPQQRRGLELATLQSPANPIRLTGPLRLRCILLFLQIVPQRRQRRLNLLRGPIRPRPHLGRQCRSPLPIRRRQTRHLPLMMLGQRRLLPLRIAAQFR